MNDAETYYRELEAERTAAPVTADTVDRAAAAIGEPLSPPNPEHV